MAPDGLKVPCKSPNVGGAGAAYGNVFSVVVQPLDSSRNPMSTSIAIVTCPVSSRIFRDGFESGGSEW